MKWKLAEAKQQLSEVVRRAAREPQVLCNRERPVAVVISADGLEDYLQWRQSRRHTFADAVDRLVQVAREERYEFEAPPRVDRPTPFEESMTSETPARYGGKKATRAPARHKRR